MFKAHCILCLGRSFFFKLKSQQLLLIKFNEKHVSPLARIIDIISQFPISLLQTRKYSMISFPVRGDLLNSFTTRLSFPIRNGTKWKMLVLKPSSKSSQWFKSIQEQQSIKFSRRKCYQLIHLDKSKDDDTESLFSFRSHLTFIKSPLLITFIIY